MHSRPCNLGQPGKLSGQAEPVSTMRELKHHEKKLLKKVDFLKWKREGSFRELQVLRRYHIQDRDDYKKYNKICGLVTKLTHMLRQLDAQDGTRIELTDLVLDKLFNMGVLPMKKSLVQCEKLATAAFCRRRLAVVMVRLKMAETLKEACTFIEQGHVRVGPETVTEPAFHVTRSMEDFVTWVDTSKIKRKVLAYNDKLDDYDLLQ
ncbi:hypothetical protein V8C86DRAFT_2451568 [Haematococcus lacustris]